MIVWFKLFSALGTEEALHCAELQRRCCIELDGVG
jgi:hypothetical protein